MQVIQRGALCRCDEPSESGRSGFLVRWALGVVVKRGLIFTFRQKAHLRICFTEDVHGEQGGLSGVREQHEQECHEWAHLAASGKANLWPSAAVEPWLPLLGLDGWIQGGDLWGAEGKGYDR